jgi:histidinol-phosphate/aromatic aminotransferase/cobyric acid decarboxylase-like protein
LRDYPDPDYRNLRQALSRHHQLSEEWILPGNGSAELLTWASRELAALETTHLFTPAFGDYRRALQAFAAQVTTHPLFPANQPPVSVSATELAVRQRIQELEQQRLDRALKLGSQQGLLLNNPHNPSGFLWSREAILPLLEQFALVVIDEAFIDFLPPDQQQSLVNHVPDYPNLVVLRSLTKFYSLPGLRLGYAIAHPDRLKRWQQWRDPWSVNLLAAVAAVAVLQDTAFQQQIWSWLPLARLQLSTGLASLPHLTPLPSAANFLLVHCHCSVTQLQQQLLQQHQILIRDCLSFAELGDAYFRVAVRQLGENQQLLDGLAAELGADDLKQSRATQG